MDKENKIIKQVKQICKKKGCYCPPDHKIFINIANTPLYLREYFKLKGKEK